MTSNKDSISVYFTSLELENVKCFGQEQKLDLTDENGGPARWTLILGENGVGKTTLLQCLAWMRPTTKSKDTTVQIDEETNESMLLLAPPIGPALPDEENEVLERLLRAGKRLELELRAELCQGRDFGDIDQSEQEKPNHTGKKIKTGIQIFYSRKRELENFELKGNTRVRKDAKYYEPFIIAYGANRQLGSQNLSLSELDDPIASRLSSATDLYDADEILNKLDHAARIKGDKSDEGKRLEEVKQLLAKVLPEDIKSSDDIKILAPNILGDNTKPSGVCLDTFSGLVPLSALSFGYQTTLAWTVDLAYRLFRRYPKSPNPLAEPAIVLIDEIDLHLHPSWQLTIIDDLTHIFPRTQFIATAHSPLIVQVASSANLVVLKKGENEVEINSDPTIVRSWRVDQILMSNLFGIPYARNKDVELLFDKRDALRDKPPQKRTRAENAQLRELEGKIADLPTASGPEDQEALSHIRQVAALLKRYTIN